MPSVNGTITWYGQVSIKRTRIKGNILVQWGGGKGGGAWNSYMKVVYMCRAVFKNSTDLRELNNRPAVVTQHI